MPTNLQAYLAQYDWARIWVIMSTERPLGPQTPWLDAWPLTASPISGAA